MVLISFCYDLPNSVFIQISLPEVLNNNSIYALCYLFQMLAKNNLFSGNIIIWGGGAIEEISLLWAVVSESVLP